MSPVIGPPRDRVDGPLKVTGGARYSAEFAVPNVAHAALVQSTVANGRITAIDTAAAEAAPGVLGVLTHHNTPRVQPIVAFPAGFGAQSLFPLQDDVVYYSGQDVAVVVADTLERAQHAASLVRVSYAEQPAIPTLAEALPAAYLPPEVAFHPRQSLRGDAAAALDTAELRLEHTYTTPVHHHNPLEPCATIAEWDGDRLTLHESTQAISNTQEQIAKQLGLPPAHVRVITQFVGGGFGCKGFHWPHTTLAALAARHVGRPVKLVLTRAQMYTSHGFQAESWQRLALGATRDGRLTAIVHDVVTQTSTYDDYTEWAGMGTPLLYACPNVAVTHRIAHVNSMTPTPMRAPQEALGLFALESELDELAYTLGLDPLEVRLRNYADVDPEAGRPWSSKYLRECYHQGAERFGWARRPTEPGTMRDGDDLLGWGMATGTHPDYRFPATARVRLHADGHAGVQSGTQDIGGGTTTVMAQVAAEALGLPAERVRFELGDTELPAAPMTGGSMTVNSVSPAVQAAALAVRRAVLQLAIADARSPLHGAREADVSVADGRLFLASAPARGESYADVLVRHGRDVVEATADAQMGAEREQYSMHAFGASFVEVRVDTVSGEVRVSRFVGAYDCGRILNAKTARSQMIGGIIFGIGQALMEHTVVDPQRARILTPNLSGYLVPVHADIPDLEVLFVGEPDPHTNALGTKGIGELPTIGVPAAVANAVYHATGRRIRDLPITPDKLL
jgi:xanthine dehydrogenase YagR molybdenum-binding subunit